MEFKTCSRCGVTRPLDEFPKKRSSPDGHNSWCKRCFQVWREENKPKMKAYRERWANKWKARGM